jgi:soluble lytic murein transglycosylase-like protein
VDLGSSARRRAPLLRAHAGNERRGASRVARALLAAGLVSIASLAATGCRRNVQPAPSALRHVEALLAALQSGDGASRAAALASISKVPRTDPDWPTITYLAGEIRIKHHGLEGARSSFRDLAVWAAEDPYKDGWGGSGLAALGLLRWLQALDENGGSRAEVDKALEVGLALYRTRLFTGMVQSGLLPALPLVEETNARLLSHVLWKAHHPGAKAVFLAFLAIDSQGDHDDVDRAITNAMVEDGSATRERLDLFRFRRQLDLVTGSARKQAAVDELRRLWSNPAAPPDVRAEAGYEWGRYHRTSREKKQEVIAVLTDAYAQAGGTGWAAERSLFLRGMVQNSVEPKRPEAFLADMNELLDRFPRSRLADDALYQIASERLFSVPPDLDGALAGFEKLRSFEGSNDWLDSAYLVAAMGLLDRGAPPDKEAADRLLADYGERFPDGAFRRRSLFWRGRIAEGRKDAAAAERVFGQIAREAPYDYYGLRARLHLELGQAASEAALPGPDSEARRALRRAFQKVPPDVELAGRTVYHERLRGAGSDGYYERALQVVNGLGRHFRRRLDSVPLAELDAEGLLPVVALVLSLRQDAQAARDSESTADNRLRLAGFLGHKVGDWPTAAAMLSFREDAPHSRLAELQNDERFLATAYPAEPLLDSLKAPLAEAAWPIDGSADLSESLMYAVMRRESGFYPGAISPVGALGLFQIMPSTFVRTEGCQTLAEPGEKPQPGSYLFDPSRNIQFWSCWVKREFKPRTRADVPLMLVKQHAGSGNLAAWEKTWKGRAIERDLEMQVDVLRFPATQAFVRGVLADLAIVDASGIFAKNPGADQGATP